MITLHSGETLDNSKENWYTLTTKYHLSSSTLYRLRARSGHKHENNKRPLPNTQLQYSGHSEVSSLRNRSGALTKYPPIA